MDLRKFVKHLLGKSIFAPEKKSWHSHTSLELILDPQWEERNYQGFADRGYIRNVIAHRSVSMIANAVSSVPLKLQRITHGGTFSLSAHPVLQLLNSPNPTGTRTEFMAKLISHKLISGNAYILLIENKGMPKELHLLRPDRVMVEPGRGNIPASYHYKVNEKSYTYRVDSITGFSNVMHLKTFHPLDDWYGLSPVEAASYSIEQHNQAGAWNQAMLQNGARPSGALMVKGSTKEDSTLSSEQYKRIKEEIEGQYSGARNAGRPILLEGGLEWKEMSLSPKDMDFIESKHSAARDIALAFGVPPQLLGIPGDNTYSNLLEARLSLWEQTVLPHLEDILSHLNSWLIPRFGHDLKLSYDKDAIDILVEKRQKLWQYVENATFMTPNEKRASFGLLPLNEGNNLQ